MKLNNFLARIFITVVIICLPLLCFIEYQNWSRLILQNKLSIELVKNQQVQIEISKLRYEADALILEQLTIQNELIMTINKGLFRPTPLKPEPNAQRY